MFMISQCIITREKALNPKVKDNKIQYTISFNGHQYPLVFSEKDDWQKFLTDERRHILSAWLWNNIWPIDSETLITEPLLERALRQVKHPGTDFYDRMDFFILQFYLNGGRERKSFPITNRNCLSAFTDSPEEYDRIIEYALKEKKWLIKDEDSNNSKKIKNSVKLTEIGITQGEKVSQLYGIPQLRKENRLLMSKNIFVCFASEDKAFGKEVQDLLSSRGAGITSHGHGITDEDLTYLYNSKESIKKCDFVILIKSASSDQVGVWRDVLGAVADYESQHPENEPFFYVLMVDDSPYKSFSHLFLKDDRLWDIRIKTVREKLFLYINEALEIRYQRNSDTAFATEAESNVGKNKLVPEKFEWPHIKLTPGQRYWLGYLYSKFRKAEEIDIDKEGPFHWGKFGNEENPTKLSSFLQSGRELTLLGIWTVDKKSRLFQLFDDGIRGIKKLFLQRGGFSSITSNDLKKILPNATSNELWCVARLIYSHGFLNGWGGSNTIDFDMHIDNSRRDRFRLYNGVEAMVNIELGDRQNIEEEEQDYPQEEYDEDFENEMFRSATEIHLHERPSKIVLDVESLAFDIATIIQQLPYQLGRMIGIFGAWGRGKSILLEEIWKFLEKSNSEWQSISRWKKFFYHLKLFKNDKLDKEIHYTNVSFHAWKYQDTPASWAYLYECFADSYYQKPKHFWQLWGWSKYLYRIIKLNSNRVKLFPFLKILGFIGMGVFAIRVLVLYKSQLQPELKFAIQLLGGTAIITILIALFDRLFKPYRDKASDLIGKYASRATFSHHMGMQAEIQKELELLLRTWLGSKDTKKFKRRILLTVEDIDRCSEDKIMHTIDGLRVMLENQNVSKWVIILCAIDERVLSRAVFSKYKGLMTTHQPIQPVQVFNYHNNLSSYISPEYSIPANNQPTELPPPDDLQSLTSEYFDKLFILAIRLGKLSQNQRLELIDSFIGEIQPDRFTPPIGSNNNSTDGNPLPNTPVSNESNTDGNESIGQSQDFTFKPDNSNSADFNNSDLENEMSDNIEGGNSFSFELFTAEERQLLRSIVRDWDNATPRQIRIFYYRYLLAKNLLIKRYHAKDQYNIWTNYPHAEYLPMSIRNYSVAHQPELIVKERERIMSEFLDSSEITLPDNYSSPIQVKDYLELLAVLEIVVAY